MDDAPAGSALEAGAACADGRAVSAATVEHLVEALQMRNAERSAALLAHGAPLADAVMAADALALAYACAHAPLLVQLARRGVDLRLDVQKNCDAVMGAIVESSSEDVLKELVAHGNLSVDCRDLHGFSLLQIACMRKREDLIEVLLELGADVAAVDSTRGDQLVHLAAVVGNTHMMQLLLEHYHQDPNVTNNLSQTPLHLAALSLQEDISRMLLAFPVDINARDVAGHTAAEHAPGGSKLHDLFAEARLEPWTLNRHIKFGPACAAILFTVLLCAKRRGLYLPQEMWFSVFGWLNREDFVTTLGWRRR
eukprot:m.216117 g.216117  ORF g.216117 m.216117 type:complete len:309 (+) comp10780_c0_seq21:1298-2224(+)